MLTIAQVGVHGYGVEHLAAIERLQQRQRVRLVAVADPASPPPGLDVPHHHSLSDLLQHHRPDIVSIAVPIGLHERLAREAMLAGAHVLLEKPPMASLDEFWALQQVQQQTGRVVQVGFQSLGSHALPLLHDMVRHGTLGEIECVAARGVWRRDRAYYLRSPWAGRRVADELARQWDAPVAVGFLAACEPRLGEAIEALRAGGAGTVAVASYLTGAGVFHRMAQQAGGDITSEPLAEHPALVELVARRFREAIAGA